MNDSFFNKLAQYTKLDEANLSQQQEKERKERAALQGLLEFEPNKKPNNLFSKPFPSELAVKDKIQKQPLSLKYPEVEEHHISYSPLSEKELNKLKNEDNDEYNTFRKYNISDAFVAPNQKYYDINKSLTPEEAKKKVLEKYNEFRSIANKFQATYEEANSIASEPILEPYGKTYAELFKDFGRFVFDAVKSHIGALFGSVPEKIKYSRTTNYSNQSKALLQYINKGLNIFNINPFNFEQKINDMDIMIATMNSIMVEYSKRKKMLNKLPSIVDEGVKSYLRQKDHREFLKFLDQYFPNDKQDFIKRSIEEILVGYANDKVPNLNTLQTIKSYGDIYFKSQMTATRELYVDIERRTKYTIEDRLQEELERRMKPRIDTFIEFLNEKPDIETIITYIFKNFRFDLKSILSYVMVVFEKKYESDKVKDEYKSFLGNFIEDLKHRLDGFFNKPISGHDRLTDHFLEKYKDSGMINFKEIEKLNSKDMEVFLNDEIKKTIINSLPNFKRSLHGAGTSSYTYPYFAGVGDVVRETGKFSIDAITNYAAKYLPFVPKDFILNLVRTLFKNAGQIENSQDVYKSISYLSGTNAQDAVKVIMDLLKRTGKLNPNSFSNVFIKNIEEINDAVRKFRSNFKNINNDDFIKAFSLVYRNESTIERDNENLDAMIDFLHNSAGNITGKELIKILENKNFVQYSKTGISRKLLNVYASIRNIGGIAGIKKKYGNIIGEFKSHNVISKDFEKNINQIVKLFNSGNAISPATEGFQDLYKILMATETDLQSMENAEAVKELMTDYQKKDKRLFDLDLQINDRLRFRVLKDKDPRMLRIGIESNCCQRIGGVGEIAARDSFINPLAGVLILEWKNNIGEWVLLGQSYFHYVPKTNGFVLDNVEENRQNVIDSGVDLNNAYAYLAKNAKEKFDVGYFLAGKSYSKIAPSKFKSKKLTGGDPRYFDKRALMKDDKSFYTDFAASNAIDLLEPKFELKSI